jgi:hypothetical protein
MEPKSTPGAVRMLVIGPRRSSRLKLMIVRLQAPIRRYRAKLLCPIGCRRTYQNESRIKKRMSFWVQFVPRVDVLDNTNTREYQKALPGK